MRISIFNFTVFIFNQTEVEYHGQKYVTQEQAYKYLKILFMSDQRKTDHSPGAHPAALEVYFWSVVAKN